MRDEGTWRHGEKETMGRSDREKGIVISKFPDKVMITFHPQRWHSNYYLWLKELIPQNAKNQVKRVLIAVGK